MADRPRLRTCADGGSCMLHKVYSLQMLRHILKKRKPSSTHITPLVTHQVLKKVLSNEKHFGPLESYEQTPQKLRLRITFQICFNSDRKPSIRY